jgi:1-acyl-sn-glycerol-3-phosphate acyltransferase
MLSFLPSWILIFITVPLFFMITAVLGGSMFLVGLVKFLLPIKPISLALSWFNNILFRGWALCNLLAMNLTNDIDWQIEADKEFKKKSWYLLVCNHISWVDILVLTQVALHQLPTPKFFLKNELKWVPFIGMAAWGLDMPFMKRFSSSYVKKHPEKKGQDIEATRRSCAKFKYIPTTIINFVEGTRFTKEKRQKSETELQNLLPPRAGGIAFTLAAMGHLFSGVLNVTLNYPDNKVPASDLLYGRLKRVQVKIEVLEVNDNIIGDYFNDDVFKARFQNWLNDLWIKKDKLITKLNNM